LQYRSLLLSAVLSVCFAMIAMPAAHVVAQPPESDLEAQFLRFLSWWPGTYDNWAQADADSSSAMPVLLHLQPVKAPGTTDDIYSWSQMRLTPTSFEYLDGWFKPDGSVYRMLADDWYVFERR
jgi:hypothetical protein